MPAGGSAVPPEVPNHKLPTPASFMET